MNTPVDAATLAAVKAALEQMTPGPWATDHHALAVTETNGLPASACEPAWIVMPPEDDDLRAEPDCAVEQIKANNRGIVALRNAAPALVAGCETLLRVRAVLDKTPPKERAICPVWDAVTDALAALDAAREEPKR